MKNNMKHRLQLRFVLLSVSALVIMQALIVAFCIFRNYQQITEKADHMIMLTAKSPESPEVSGARYFMVVYDFQNKTFETDLSHTSLVKREAAIEYAKKVIEEKSDKGFIESYRYHVHRRKNSISITFLSRSLPLESFHSYSKTLIFISGTGIVFMSALLILFSGKIVKPLVENHQKQKEFITSASHELKTPLTVINADAQLLESEIGENEWLSDIIDQTKRMAEMTHRLVYLAKAEEQNDFFVKIDFPVSDLADEVAQSYRSVAHNCNKNYLAEIQKGLSYCGDEKAIRELMTALLDNAFKYGTADGDVTVKLVAERNGIRFSVENAVSGIDSAQIQKFTNRFYRADTSDNIKGFGIGLSIAQVVAEAHKGNLSVELVNENTIRFSALLK